VIPTPYKENPAMSIRSLALAATAGLILAFAAADASAIECAAGVYRAGCVGPNGAAAVHRPPETVVHPVTGAGVAHPAGYVHCADGVWRAACVGPNGAAVIRR
jgi:hypothetical protein